MDLRAGFWLRGRWLIGRVFRYMLGMFCPGLPRPFWSGIRVLGEFIWFARL